ncbi:hypothetical protein BIT28_11975 [Photobacterium proteolyticum]|uniref:Uncharacterized protein n=2 Tax=Photobacterium proteolyticum TaxID=1903952 RepID=A0A1Q9GF76_9GAMM|nr:hypothetical protein BIT28_11975 [Photobacterium proteolyticum]
MYLKSFFLASSMAVFSISSWDFMNKKPAMAYSGAYDLKSTGSSYHGKKNIEVFIEDQNIDITTIFSESGLKNIVEVHTKGTITKDNNGQYSMSITDENYSKGLIASASDIRMYNDLLSAARKLPGHNKWKVVESTENYIVIATNHGDGHLMALNRYQVN